MPIAFDDPLIAGMAIRRTRWGQAVLDAWSGSAFRSAVNPGPLNTQVL
jgi:hypothetical protein